MDTIRMLQLKLMILIISSFSCLTHTKPSLIALAKEITAAHRYSDGANARQALLKELKKTPRSNAQTLSTILTAYHYKKETYLYSEHSHTLYEAIDLFNRKSGFTRKIYDLICNADNKGFVEGHVYELEKALALTAQGEKITHFGYQFTGKDTGTERTIDLATKSAFIECKNITWHRYTTQDESTPLQRQLLSYQALSQEKDIPFVLHSKQPITTAWQQWLNDNNITYAQDAQS